MAFCYGKVNMRQTVIDVPDNGKTLAENESVMEKLERQVERG